MFKAINLLGRFRRGKRGKAGNAAVEFALIAPILASALVAMVDLGVGFYERMEVENAAQAGAQYAISKGWNPSAVVTAVTSASSLASISAVPGPTQSCGCPNGTTLVAAACGSTCPGGALAGTYVTVNAQAQYATILNYPGLTSPVTLTAQAVVRTQ
jgi:Flp pilus assembly protein TadG